MSSIPGILEATVLNEDGEPSADILVSLATFCDGQYYYGDIMGLTDRRGVVRLSRRQLEQDFRRDQASFPMDYRVSLDQCDPVIEILLRGGAQFREAKNSVLGNGLVDPDVKLLYERARNEQFDTSARRVDLRDASLPKVAVELTATATG